MKILLAYRPSAPADAAAEFAISEAKVHGASLLVLASEQGKARRRGDAEPDERALSARLEASGVPHELRTVPRRDDPADDILRAIEDDGVDMVVLGVRRRTPVGKMLMGSTAQRIVMDAPCPVVCVKPASFVPPKF